MNRCSWNREELASPYFTEAARQDVEAPWIREARRVGCFRGASGWRNLASMFDHEVAFDRYLVEEEAFFARGDRERLSEQEAVLRRQQRDEEAASASPSGLGQETLFTGSVPQQPEPEVCSTDAYGHLRV